MRRVTYQCNRGHFGGDFPQNSTAVDELMLYQSKGLSEGTLVDFTGELQQPGVKRMCESLEPRPAEKRMRLQQATDL